MLAEDEDLDVHVVERRRPASLLAEIEKSSGANGERRRWDDLRAEVNKALNPASDEKGSGIAWPRNKWGEAIKPSRILLLVVALMAGGVAAYLAVQRPTPVTETVTETAVQMVAAPKAQVLVASQSIGMGQRLGPSSVEWQDWPVDAVRSDFITSAATPEAITDMSGAMARYEFFPGEPILEKKLVRADQGYLSAILDAGLRGVSVTVTADSASGGFVVPNDHVDVVLTRQSDTNHDSETILHNVRVLAINTRLGETGTTGAPPPSDAATADPSSQVFVDQAIATLALDPGQAEVVISASSLGKLSLVLLSMADFSKADTVDRGATNAAIRLTSPFWSK